MKLFNVSMLQNIHSITFYNSLKCVGFLVDKSYIQTVPGTKQHRFILRLTILLHLWFFRHKKRLRSLEHLQGRETVYLKLYYSVLLVTLQYIVILCSYNTPSYTIFAATLFRIWSKKIQVKLLSVFCPELSYLFTPSYTVYSFFPPVKLFFGYLMP